ncbi:hypothetical protein SAMN02745115_01427 [[Eubacterium] yurii]|jgi:hypothetical protein|nr:hypothetical protein SAMN02745115_01427 [[Eubacterium] yurii]
MKKSAVLKFLAVICLLSFIVACNENTDISKKNTEDNATKNISQSDNKINKVEDNTAKDNEIKEKARAVIYDTKIKELKKEEKTGQNIPAASIDIAGLKKRSDGYSVFANIIEMTYKFDNGIFDNDSGALFPIRYDMNLDFKIVKTYEVEDGERSIPSIGEMAENDEKLIEKMMGSPDSFSSKYDVLMEEIKKNAEIAGLKNFSHKKNEIPGYEKDVREIDDDTPDGVICIIKNKDYDKVQEERKEIVPSTVAGKHAVYAPCIWYHEKTGICVKKTVWYYN